MMKSASKDANLTLDKGSFASDTKMTKSTNEISQTNVTKAQANSSANTASLAELFSLATPFDIILMILGVIGSMGTGVSIPIFNVLFGKMLDNLNSPGVSFESVISDLCLIFVYIGIANMLAGYLQVACWTMAGERQTQKFRETYVKAILSQEIGWFDECGASTLATRVADLSGKVEDGLGRKTGDMLQYITQTIAAFVIAFYFSWSLTLVLLCTLPFIAISGAYMITAITSATNLGMEQYSAAGGLATESLRNIRTVTALNAQCEIINQYRKYLFHAMKIGIIKGVKIGIGNGALFGFCFLTYALGFWYGGELIANSLQSGCSNDCVTGGTILSVFFCVIMGSMGMGQIAPPMSSFFEAKASAKPMLDIIRRKPLIDGLSDEGLKPDTKPQGKITIENVIFAYPSRPHIDVCKGYNLNIESGETVALVGASGSGKSTVINLLLRFYDPQSGCIRLDGTDIRQLNIRWLRANIGYVGQEPVLFSGTIAENIAYGLDAALFEEVRVLRQSVDPIERQKAQGLLRQRVEEAAKLANAHEFIMKFPQNYETDVGSSGSSMSGGQKQRIAIARALIKRPAVLLLDEATSALDAASERLVQESIDKLQQSKMQTTIVIAHRLSTIRTADKIAVVSEGLIAELGTHDELMGRNGLYADLIQLQVSAMAPVDDGALEEEEVGILRETTVASKDVDIEAATHSYAAAGHDEHKAQDETHKQAHHHSSPTAEDVIHAKGNDKKEGDVTTDIVITKEEKSKAKNQLWSIVYRYTHWLAISIVGAAIFGAIFPAWGLLLARTQNVFYYTNPQEIRDSVAFLAGMFCIMGLGAFVGSVMQFYGISEMSERVTMTLRSDAFEAIVRREIGFFDQEENAVGTLTTRLSDDSRLVAKTSGVSTARQFQAFFTLAVGLIIAFTASWKVTLVVLATFPVSIAASALQMQAIAGQQYDGKDGGDNQGGVISSAFTNMRTVAAFSVQFKVADDYAASTRVVRDAKMHRSHVAGIGFGFAQASTFFTYALLFWYGSTLVQSGEITFVDLMTAILTLMLGALGLGMALNDLGDQNQGLQAAHRIFKLIDDGKSCSIDGLSMEGLKPSHRLQGSIELKNVNFSYPTRPDAKVCKDYNLVIAPGEVVALVGPSGSGKSTIMNLLLRFYDPLSGQVLLDGNDIKSLNVRWLRSQIGYVGQEPALFKGSITDNISRGRAEFGDVMLLSLEDAMKLADSESHISLFGSLCSSSTPSSTPDKYVSVSKEEIESNVKPSDRTLSIGDLERNMSSMSAVSTGIDGDIGGTPEDVIMACKDSNAHEFIRKFPQKYDTDVGESSIMVSGGQKQRIAIARALIKRPAVLLLDEATSALDAASERLVQESIDKLQQSKMQTTIVIAHRLTTIKNADKIVVIDKGEVAEIGTHEQLLEKENGIYAHLWSKQTGSK